MDDNVLSTIDEYYKLKNKYEKNIFNKKKNIINNVNLTKKEKINKINQLKKCINCKKIGGTIFLNKNGILIAKCGNIESPCNLNIEIDRGYYDNIYNLFIKYKNEFSNLKENIIKLKCDYIFKYKNPDEVNDMFLKLKENIKNTEKELDKLKELYNNIINNVKNEYKLNMYSNNLNSEIKEFISLNKQYNETNDNDYLKEIVVKYRDIVLPLLYEIRNIKYKTNYVEYDDINAMYNLIQNLYNSKDFEIILNNKPKIINKNYKL